MSIHALDWPFVLKNTALRKAVAYALQAPRALASLGAYPERFVVRPPIIVNSIPKSGTHLLLQMARALPQSLYFGSFLAQAPSLTLKPRSQATIDFHISRIVPGEVVGAHLHYSPETSRALQKINALHLFIMRDPYDIAMSEQHYLAHMNRFHRMSREFQGLSPEKRLDLVMNGSKCRPDLYPSIEKRLTPYLGWMSDSRVLTIRFEHVSTDARRREVAKTLAEAWEAKVEGAPVRTQDLDARICNAVSPARSHTFVPSGAKERLPGWNWSDVDRERLDGLAQSMGYDRRAVS